MKFAYILACVVLFFLLAGCATIDMDYIEAHLADEGFDAFELELDAEPYIMRHNLVDAWYKLKFDILGEKTYLPDSPIGVRLGNGLFVDSSGNISIDIIEYFDIEDVKKIVEVDGRVIEFNEGKVVVGNQRALGEFKIEFTIEDGQLNERRSGLVSSHVIYYQDSTSLSYTLGNPFHVIKEDDLLYKRSCLETIGLVKQENRNRVIVGNSLNLFEKDMKRAAFYKIEQIDNRIEIYDITDKRNQFQLFTLVKLDKGFAIYEPGGGGVLVEMEDDVITFKRPGMRYTRRIQVFY